MNIQVADKKAAATQQKIMTFGLILVLAIVFIADKVSAHLPF